jgi:hypothetical protein
LFDPKVSFDAISLGLEEVLDVDGNIGHGSRSTVEDLLLDVTQVAANEVADDLASAVARRRDRPASRSRPDRG